MRIEIGNRVEFNAKGNRGRRLGIVQAISSKGRAVKVVAKLAGDDLLIVFDDADEPFHVDGRDVSRVFVRRNVTIASTRIVRDEDGEYRVKAYDASGKRLSRADYFTDDRDDARATAAAMVGGSRTIDAEIAEPVELTIGELDLVRELDVCERDEIVACVRYWGEIDVDRSAFHAIPVRLVVESLERDAAGRSVNVDEQGRSRVDSSSGVGIWPARRLADLIRPAAVAAGVELDDVLDGSV